MANLTESASQAATFQSMYYTCDPKEAVSQLIFKRQHDIKFNIQL
jgi:hypothetical protein